MKSRFPYPSFKVFRHVPLAVQMLLFTLGLGMGIWILLAEWQERELRGLFRDELRRELEHRAAEDRHRFDEQVQWIHHAAKIVASQKQFLDYVEQGRFGTGGAVAEGEGYFKDGVWHYQNAPEWMPSASVMRAFFYARHAVLLDAEGRVREVYHHIPHRNDFDLPAALRAPSVLLRKLSHNQAYMTSFDGHPYVIAAHLIEAPDGRPLATLMLEAPLDDEFLFAAAGYGKHGSIMALVEPDSGKVIASSAPDRIPSGVKVQGLVKRFLMMGKSFFDYGASDLNLQFASFIATDEGERLSSTILKKNHQQRLLLVALMVGAFALLTTWLAARIRVLSREVVVLGRDRLGTLPESAEQGDEIWVLERQFHALGSAVVDYRERLQIEVRERIELSRLALLGEQHEAELSRLQRLTESLGVGIVVTRVKGPAPFNPLMERYIAECGGMRHFLLAADEREVERVLKCDGGGERVFTITRYSVDEDEALLVREVTEERQLKEERRLFTSFPARNPNPVLRIGVHDGVIRYANDASREILEGCSCKVGKRMPASWLEQIDAGMTHEQLLPLEVKAAGRFYTFEPAVIEGADFLYLYGRDVTSNKLAERELRMAAAVAEHVLDAILVTDSEGTITQVNPAFTEVTGYSADEVVGHNARLLKSNHHDGNFYRDMWQSLLLESQWRGEVWNRHKAGDLLPCMVSIRAIRDEGDKILNFVAILSDISEHKAREERLSQMAYRDPLTGLPNRTLLVDRLGQALVRAERDGNEVALMFIDLDEFKQVNDTMGHDVGDVLLREVAARLRDLVRGSDSVGRLGGDEFVVVLPDFKHEKGLAEVAEKICSRLSAPYLLDGQTARVSASIGIALYPRDGVNAEELMNLADGAMYRAKRGGKNRFVFHQRQASVTRLHQSAS